MFSEIFNHIVRECVKKGIVSGDSVVSDGSFIPANVAEYSLVELKQEVSKSTVRYMEVLDEKLHQQPGYRDPIPTVKEKIILKSSTDADCGYIIKKIKKVLAI